MAFLNWWNDRSESENYSLEIKRKDLFPTTTSNQALVGADTARTIPNQVCPKLLMSSMANFLAKGS